MFLCVLVLMGAGATLYAQNEQTTLPSAYKPLPFSVSADRQILFASGNLQYNAAHGTHACADGSTKQGTWRFAEHQYDYVGDAENGNVYQNGVKCDNALIGATYDGWIDLFGWGTSGWNSGANEYQPWATSPNYSDYYPGGNYTNNLTGDYANADWGQYNAVGNDPAGTWRTLTRDELGYLFNTRPNASNKYGAAIVNGLAGLVLLPDAFTLPAGCGFTAGMTSASRGSDWSDVASTNIYTAAQWQQMEAAGAVFLPCGGRRHNDGTISYVGTYGGCWSSTADNSNDTYGLGFESNALYWRNGIRSNGYPVRLVKDHTPPPPPEEGCTDVTTEFSYTMYKGETYLWEGTEYKVSGDHTKTFPKADGCDSIVTLHLTVLPPECLGNYDTVRFCPGLNAEHDEVVRHGYCLRYLPYRYESPEEWDYMEGVVLVRDSDRTLVDLPRAERNLREHYTEDLTPVQSVHWSLCKNGTNEYHAIEVENEPQWIEAGTLSLSVYFLCGQRYYSNFATDLGNVQGDDVPCTKVLLNGQLYLLRGDHIFDAQGKLVK